MRHRTKWVLLAKMNDDPADHWEESMHSPAGGSEDRGALLRLCAKLKKNTDLFFYCVSPLHNCETNPKTRRWQLKAGFEKAG